MIYNCYTVLSAMGIDLWGNKLINNIQIDGMALDTAY